MRSASCPTHGSRRVALLLLLGCLAPSGGPATADAESDVGQRAAAVIVSLRGEVWIHRPDTAAPIEATLSMRLRTGDEIHAADNSSATIYFPGGHIVRVPEGNRLEVLKGSPSTQAGSGRVARMSDRTLEVLEDGLWILSDSDGRFLVWAMRGESRNPSRTTLSPRNEITTTARPTFYWKGIDGRVRLVIEHEREILWRSEPLSGSFLRYPGDAQELAADRPHRWWLESADSGMRLTEPAYFKVPGPDLIRQVEVFESELVELQPMAGEDLLADFLRCAYYEQIGAWTPLLQSAARLKDSDGAEEFIQKTMARARYRMGLSEELVETLIQSE